MLWLKSNKKYESLRGKNKRVVHTVTALSAERQKRAVWSEGIRDSSTRDVEPELAVKVDLKAVNIISNMKYIYLWLSGRLLLSSLLFFPTLVYPVCSQQIIL